MLLSATTAPTTPDILRRIRQARLLAEVEVQKLRQLEHELEKGAATPAPTPRRPHQTGYELFGQFFPAPSGAAILVGVFRQFAQLSPEFPALFAARVSNEGTVRPYVAQSRSAVYPNKPLLIRSVKEFAPGWFVGTNEDNAKKKRLIRTACEVLGLTFEEDVRIWMS
jgi:hypothetical protein